MWYRNLGPSMTIGQIVQDPMMNLLTSYPMTAWKRSADRKCTRFMTKAVTMAMGIFKPIFGIRNLSSTNNWISCCHFTALDSITLGCHCTATCPFPRLHCSFRNTPCTFLSGIGPELTTPVSWASFTPDAKLVNWTETKLKSTHEGDPEFTLG